jgi:hypothetical protein
METQETAKERPERIVRVRERMEGVREQLRQIPEDSFLIGAALSIGASLLLRSIRKHQDAYFVGQWAPTLLLLGLYAKRRREMRGEEEQPCAVGAKGEVH